MFFSLRNCTISAIVARPRWKKAYLKPKMILSGNWLKEAGFETGEKVEIQVFKNKLIIKSLKNGNTSR